MKTIIQKIIRLRNPQFAFDPALSNTVIMRFIMLNAWSMLRGMRLLLSFRNPALLMLGKGVRFFNLSHIKFGKMVRIGDFTYLSAMGSGNIELGHNSSIGAFSRLVISTSLNNIGKHIKIGNNVGIGEYAYLGGGGGLEIKDDCIIGQYLSCHPENHHFMDDRKLIRRQGVSREGIVVGKNCWIGAKVTILDGVTIGDSCVVAAGAVVTKDMPSHSVIGGVPAKVIKRYLAVEEKEHYKKTA
jgi:acetyltransferase-like isoleucine patch superfamily enzyme